MPPARVKAICVDLFVESFDQLKLSEIPAPIVQPGTILIRVSHVSISYVDILYVRGLHQNNRRHVKPPFTAGQEFSGIVVDSQCGEYDAGDHVYGAALGAFASYLVVPPDAVTKIPSGWDLRGAAGMAATAPVSYGALVRAARLLSHDIVLIHGATGGLGVAAVQIARILGCRVIATTGSAAKAKVLQRLGVHPDDIVDCSQEKWTAKVLHLTNGRGVNVVFDSVGMIQASIKCCAYNARILIIGFAGRQDDLELLPVNRVLLKSIQLLGYRFGETLRQNGAEAAIILQGLAEMTKRGLKPVVFDQVLLGLESVPQAMQQLHDRQVWGKIIVDLPDEAPSKI